MKIAITANVTKIQNIIDLAEDVKELTTQWTGDMEIDFHVTFHKTITKEK